MIVGHENDAVLALESAELAVQANPATGALSVRDKRTGVEWRTIWTPASLAPSFANTPRFTLSGAELVVEADFSALSGGGSAFPAPLTPNPGDALVFPMSEGFRIPFDECDLFKGSEVGAWHGSGMSMPVFGVVDAADEGGFMVILETPEDAKVKFFADAADTGVGAVAPLWTPECGSPGYTRRARFVFFKSGGYVAMAKRYRAYAAAQGLVKTFTEKAAERPLVERLPGAANIWYFPSSGEPSHAAMAAEMRAAGIDRFLWNWNSEPRPSDLAAIAAMTNTLAGRYDVCRDVYYPDLLDALGWANPPESEIARNTSAWPDDIAWDSTDSNDWRRAWAMTGTNGATYHCAAQCDIPAVARLRRLAGDDLTNNPYTARFIDVTAAKGWEECYNPAHPMTRRVSRNAKTDLLRMLCEEFSIVVGSEQGMDAFVPVCDYFEGMMSPTAARMPARRDGYGRSARFRDDGGVPSQLTAKEWAKMERYAMNERYRIPLFELVYHDCVASHWYWYDYSNSPVYYWWKRDIFNALYGTAPMYIFDYQMWTERRAEFLASWNRVGGIARRTGFSEMLSHRALTADRSVQETRFADGTVVTVDFNAGNIDTGGYIVDVPEGQARTIDTALVAALGSSDLVKTGRGTLVSSNVMSNYTGTIIVREGVFEIHTSGDLGTAVGGTVVENGGTLVVDMASGQAGPGDYIYRHRGMMTGYRADGWEAGYNTDRADTQWSYCDYGPGPQLTRDGYWDENDDHAYNGETRARVWCSRGYIWNRAATNVTYTVFVGCVYQTYVYIDGTLVYNNKRDSWGNSYSFELPAGTCKSIDIRTTDGKVYGGPRSDSDKFRINGVVANDPTGWFFTTNAVSEVESPVSVASLALAGGAIDMRGVPLEVGALSGAGLVTNAPAFTVSDSWTFPAADIANGARLAVDGGLVFGDGFTFAVTGLRDLPASGTYTICTADSINGFTSGMTVSDGARVWKLVLSGDGRSITMKIMPQNTVFHVR